MEKYNYREAMDKDIMDYIVDEIGYLDQMTIEQLEEIAGESEALYERFYDDMFVSDRITGNASGSYTFNRWQAEENICHNFDLLSDAFYEFGLKAEAGAFEAEYLDVTIRCYLLSDVLMDVCERLADNAEALLACMGAENHDR